MVDVCLSAVLLRWSTTKLHLTIKKQFIQSTFHSTDIDRLAIYAKRLSCPIHFVPEAIT